MSLLGAVHMSPAFNGEVLQYSASNTLGNKIKTRRNFYLGLPHIQCTYIVLELVLGYTVGPVLIAAFNVCILHLSSQLRI